MRTKAFLLVFFIVFIFSTVSVYAQEVNIKNSMRAANSVLRDLQQSANGEDYFKIAENFWKMADIFQKLSVIKPPKGSEAVWKNMHIGIVEASFRGIGACADKDKQTIKNLIKVITEIEQSGHSSFR